MDADIAELDAIVRRAISASKELSINAGSIATRVLDDLGEAVPDEQRDDFLAVLKARAEIALREMFASPRRSSGRHAAALEAYGATRGLR